jgi:hypothetical protein
VRIHVDQSAELTAGRITHHVFDDGSAYLELGTDRTIGQSILIWAGRDDADLAEEARALRKLAEVASDLAAGLERRAGLTSQTSAGDDAGRAIAADLDVQAGPRCPASRIGFGPCALRSFHPGWHENLVGAGWPQYDEDIELDAALTGDAYRLPAAEVTR